MKMATKKQVEFFLSLFTRYVRKLKQEQRFYSKDYSIQYVCTVHNAIERGEDVQMKHISVAIEDMQKVLKS